MKKTVRIALIIAVITVLLCGCPASALSLNSYTYSEPGTSLSTPDPYQLTATMEFSGSGGLSDAQDFCIDSTGRMYIADTGNNRILILDESGRQLSEITHYPADGADTAFRSPGGVYVSGGKLYVADTQNGRIVIFTDTGEFSGIIGAPESEALRDDFVFQPSRIAVNDLGYVYAVGAGMIEGIAEFDASGEFVRFAACNETAPNMLKYFWTRTFATDKQKEVSALFLSEEFNSVAIDREGYFMTVSTTAGVRRFNTKGDNITKTAGDFLLVGDYKTTETEAADTMQDKDGKGVSKFTDIAVGEQGIYSVIDTVYQRVFTYDYEGNLLWAFGVPGNINGAFKKLSAINYGQNGDIFVLDSELNRISVFSLTAFGRQVQAGAMLRYAGDNDGAAKEWALIGQYDSSYPFAYLGKGLIAYNSGEYRQAMTDFRLAGNDEYYSKAFVYYRRELINRIFPWLMSGLAVSAVLVCVLLRVLRRKRQKAPVNFYTDSSDLTLIRQLRYSKYVMLHPFKAFWDMKVERKASAWSATILLGLLVAVNTLKAQSTGFLFDTGGFGQLSIFKEIRTVFLAALIWCAANWALTTLMDGEGTFRQIYIMTAYSVTPLLLSQLLTWVLSHALSLEEGAVISVIGTIGAAFAVLLLFIGTVVTHQYSFGKNLAAWLLTAVAIAAILFLAMIGVEMTDWVITFIKTLGREIILAVS